MTRQDKTRQDQRPQKEATQSQHDPTRRQTYFDIGPGGVFGHLLGVVDGCWAPRPKRMRGIGAAPSHLGPQDGTTIDQHGTHYIQK
jgi:hypothetical protein